MKEALQALQNLKDSKRLREMLDRYDEMAGEMRELANALYPKTDDETCGGCGAAAGEHRVKCVCVDVFWTIGE